MSDPRFLRTGLSGSPVGDTIRAVLNIRYKPRIKLLWIVLPVLAVLVALGGWDLYRWQWKAALIEELQIRGRAPAIALPADYRIPVADLVFRPVRLSGIYLHESTMRLVNQDRDGKPGSAIITPFVRFDGGPTLLVNRGWAPLDWTGPTAEDIAAQHQEIEVIGIVLVPVETGWLTPSNDPDGKQWHYMDLSGMAGSVGILPFVDYYIFATGEAPVVPEPPAPAEGAETGETPPAPAPAPVETKEPPASPYPIANVWRADRSNDHLFYSAVWFSLAAVILAGFIVYRMRFAPGATENDSG